MLAAMPILKFLHILSMFSAVGVVVGTEVLLHRVARSGDVRAMRTAFALAKPMNVVAPALFLIGVALGVIDGLTRGFDLFAPWLLIAYGLFLTMFVLGGAVQGRWIDRMVAAVASAGDEPPSPELERVINDRVATAAMYLSWLLLAGIIFTMVIKPFS
jgi:hypothetical protein